MLSIPLVFYVLALLMLPRRSMFAFIQGESQTHALCVIITLTLCSGEHAHQGFEIL